MIQDIFPHIFHNEFHERSSLPGDLVTVLAGGKTYLTRSGTFPTAAEVKALGVEEGDLVSYSVANRTINMTGIHGVPCTVEEATAELAKRAEKGIIPREPRKGFYRMYTEHARSAMQGGGLE